jgi:hypothetical protein
MQNTRLNTLVQTVTGQIDQLFRNPWRRISLVLISVLLGFFLGNAISTTAGQRAEWDILAAFLLVVVTEITNRIVYGGTEQIQRSRVTESVNALKIGVTYSLFLDAFKLGS